MGSNGITLNEVSSKSNENDSLPSNGKTGGVSGINGIVFDLDEPEHWREGTLNAAWFMEIWNSSSCSLKDTDKKLGRSLTLPQAEGESKGSSDSILNRRHTIGGFVPNPEAANENKNSPKKKDEESGEENVTKIEEVALPVQGSVANLLKRKRDLEKKVNNLQINEKKNK